MVCERWLVCVWKMVCQRWCVKDGVWKMVCDKVVCERWCVKDGVWKMVVDKDVCERWYVKDCGWKMVCDRWWLTKVCVRDGVWEMVCERWCVKDDGWQRWCVKDVCEEEAAGGGRRRGRTRDTESKTRTPHKDVGKKTWTQQLCYQIGSRRQSSKSTILKPWRIHMFQLYSTVALMQPLQCDLQAEGCIAKCPAVPLSNSDASRPNRLQCELQAWSCKSPYLVEKRVNQSTAKPSKPQFHCGSDDGGDHRATVAANLPIFRDIP